MSRRHAITPQILDVARHLGASPRGDVGDAIVQKAREVVDDWVNKLGPVATLPELLDLVAAKLCLHFEVVREDEDIQMIAKKYLKRKEIAFATLEDEFAKATDAIVYGLHEVPDWSDQKYVAVVDARGWKRPRVWFSKWHEVAHLIAEPPQGSFAYRRTRTTKRDPLERLMDQIGGTLAFYEPLFLPVLEASGFDLDAPTLKTLFIHRNMRVPTQSVIWRVYYEEYAEGLVRTEERLSWWESEGNALADIPIAVEATGGGADRVLALVVRHDGKRKHSPHI